MVDLNSLVQALLFAIFVTVNTVLSGVIGPSYDGLVVPELNGPALYPALPVGSTAGGGFLGLAAEFSNYLLVNLVDPAVAIVIVAVAIAYMVRGTLGPFGPRLQGLFPRTLIAVIVANFTVPIANAMLGLGGAVFPTIAQFDGGAWRHWSNLAGVGSITFTWDNGAVAFVLSLAMFLEVMLLALALAFRDAALAVLLVLLPMFTLLWPIPPLAVLARRAWKLFGELVFLPCVMLVPLELAVNSANAPILIAFLGLAVSSPALISTAGAHLAQLGFPTSSGASVGSLQRGFGSLSGTAAAPVRGATGAAQSSAPVASGVSAAVRTAGASTFPATIPLLTGEVLGRGGYHLVRHLQQFTSTRLHTAHLPPVRPPGSGR